MKKTSAEVIRDSDQTLLGALLDESNHGNGGDEYRC